MNSQPHAYEDSYDQVRTDANLLTRFDRLPVTRSVVIAIVLLALVWLVESFDIGIVSTLVLVLKPHWHLASSDTGLLGASATIGLVLGIFPAGRLADRFGRKRVLIAGVTVFSVFTLASALVTSLWPLFVLRVIAGFGEGAVFPLPYTILSEMVNKRGRGHLMGWTNGVLNAGYTLPALAGFWTTSAFGWNLAWRVPLLIGGGFIILVPFLIKWLPETPRYLLKRAEAGGGQADRDRVRSWVRTLEREAGLPHDETIIDAEAYEVLRSTRKRDVRIRTILKPPYLGRSVVAWCTMCSSFVLWYTFLTYSPTILGGIGVKGSQALLYTAIMMLISGVGTLAQGIGGDRWGRRPVFATYIVLGALGMVGLSFRSLIGTSGVIAAGIVIAWFGLGSFALCKIYTAEQYPTRLRGLGTSTAEMITRALTGGVLIYFLPGLFARWGPPSVFTACAIAMVLLLIPIVFFGHETRGQNMEVLGTPLAGRAGPGPEHETVTREEARHE
ncbi:MFS transporter [Amycolatopsis sp. K13G38]|uniref:MFS transporter n=1 Tax=Amycolatopsis acididurans TaxID=2724524 RepID=A0ABX1J212_9PSEU|nr:MFS transporter [Amycolatopsis acididurans]NKQ52306.1 MFS transporter [Amycolatopsis acididurans]